jgi:hypothetical protein
MEDYEWIKEKLIEQEINNRLSAKIVKTVYEKLIEVAKKQKGYERGIIFYEEIMGIAGLEREDPYDREIVLCRMLACISIHEDECKKPMLSAVVVHKPNPQMGILPIPGDGFFELAYELGKYNGSKNEKDKMRLFSEEIKKVWDYWSKH